MTTTTRTDHSLISPAAEVRAFLAGATQFRRVVVPQPKEWQTIGNEQCRLDRCSMYDGHVHFLYHARGCLGRHPCPWGVPGDRIAVKECFAPIPPLGECPGGYAIPGSPFYGHKAWYRADNDRPTWGGPWKSSTQMPKKFCRLWLEVVEVRVERLNSISHAGIIAEGIDVDGGNDEHRNRTSWENFALYWDSTHSKPGHRWKDNPFVWCGTVKRIASAILESK